MLKRIRYRLNYSGQGFCPLKIEITQFRDGLRFKTACFLPKVSYYRESCMSP